jgi:hypothetical protein
VILDDLAVMRRMDDLYRYSRTRPFADLCGQKPKAVSSIGGGEANDELAVLKRYASRA